MNLFFTPIELFEKYPELICKIPNNIINSFDSRKLCRIIRNNPDFINKLSNDIIDKIDVD